MVQKGSDAPITIGFKLAINSENWWKLKFTYDAGYWKFYLNDVEVPYNVAISSSDSNYAEINDDSVFNSDLVFLGYTNCLIDEIKIYNDSITTGGPMVPTFQKLNLLLAKQQSALGTKAPSALTVTDQSAVDDTFELNYKQESADQSLAQAIFGQPQTVRGMAEIECKVTMPIIPTGSATVPTVGKYLNSCGMSYALATNKHSWAPSSDVATDWHDMSMNGYTGDKTTGDSILTKAHSAMFDVEIAGEVGKMVTATFTGKAVPDGVPAAASYPTGSVTAISTSVPAVLKNATQTINGLTLHILKFAFKTGNDIQLVKDMNDASGHLQAMIVGRKSTMTCTVYMENASSNNPLTGMAAGTLATTTLKFGSATDYLISIISGTNKSEIVDCKPSVDNGLMCWDISLNFVDNSVTLAINDA
jgi:hypothetical protein